MMISAPAAAICRAVCRWKLLLRVTFSVPQWANTMTTSAPAFLALLMSFFMVDTFSLLKTYVRLSRLKVRSREFVYCV